ncbi:MAG: SpoIID/LytB domain-containing protein [Gaiellaceae bacterium MAG52_C11]|nr:SpoIID/LytB domain-containing protein [Candidatus Gaiellasilicea maunaloa]
MRRLLISLAVALACATPASAGTVFVIDGRGWGHGVGMSQYGARGYAEAGWGHARILAHYYRGTKLRLVPTRPVRVLLVEGRPAVQISSTKPFRVVDATGRVRKLKPGARTLAASGLLLRGLRAPLRFEAGVVPLQLDGAGYRGALVVHRQGGSLLVVNDLPLDRYLRGVVPWEMPDDWHPAALRAQAVVARSYALATLKPGKLFDLYADTRSQVYGGIRAEEDSTNRAIGATAGRALLWQNRVATTFYHSTSGGRTASVADVWPKARVVPYLVSVPDPYDNISKHHRWGPFRMTPAEVETLTGTRDVRDLLVERTASGRVTEVTVKVGDGLKRIEGQDFRRSFNLRSTWFSVRVLNLDPPLLSALASRQLRLTGFVRGLTKVRLEQQVNGGTWTTVKRIRTRVDGRFAVAVAPLRTTSYRLASPQVAGGAVTVRPRKKL